MAKDPKIIDLRYITRDLYYRYRYAPKCICAKYIYSSAECGHLAREAKYTCDERNNRNNQRKRHKRHSNRDISLCPKSAKLPTVNVTEALIKTRCKNCVKANERWKPQGDGGSIASNLQNEKNVNEESATKQLEQLDLLERPSILS